eukprot:TRINITY_DN2905_c0_g1_i1.p1 TRINITY_DN2905_c0_g1~~TRINITY_DN2905_c0_g1_i1.p1  ORF type:complete len:328 (+),score=63.26 TRINITY_DN2905_c0_g1_i1:262-1245(+)
MAELSAIAANNNKGKGLEGSVLEEDKSVLANHGALLVDVKINGENGVGESVIQGEECGNCDSQDSKTKLTDEDDQWLCAICHNRIAVEDTAHVKGCEHVYCACCILQWASYKSVPWCPQCRLPFSSLYVYRTLDGSLSDAMVEESVCLLLRATWFTPSFPEEEVDDYDGADFEDAYGYCDEEEDYYPSTIRIGNRRWGENGYVRGGRMQARPRGGSISDTNSSQGIVMASAASTSSSSSPSSVQTKGKQGNGVAAHGGGGDRQKLGRRAKRSQKRSDHDNTAKPVSSRSISTSSSMQQQHPLARPSAPLAALATTSPKCKGKEDVVV